jgi:hypothetical protein
VEIFARHPVSCQFRGTHATSHGGTARANQQLVGVFYGKRTTLDIKGTKPSDKARLISKNHGKIKEMMISAGRYNWVISWKIK